MVDTLRKGLILVQKRCLNKFKTVSFLIKQNINILFKTNNYLDINIFKNKNPIRSNLVLRNKSTRNSY